MIDILIDDGLEQTDLPSESDIQHAVQAICTSLGYKTSDEAELCIRFAIDTEVQSLNAQWRDKDKVTDVLSFPMQEGPDYDLNESLGDIVLASQFVAQEAKRLHLTPQAHNLHLIVHGVLHLFGYDHIHDEDALVMQAMEPQIMQGLGLHEPYTVQGG